jgi:hypothetical protein
MSAWAHLYSLASSWIKRPAVWLGGILAAAIGTFVTTTLLTPVQTFLSKKTAEKACEYRQKPIANDSQFTILVSPLKYDQDGSHTEKVKSAFHGEKGFLVVPICESVAFDYSMLIGMLDMMRDVINCRSKFEKERQWTCSIQIHGSSNGRRS